MVGTACFRFRFRGTSHCLTTVFLSKSHYSSPHPYFIQVIGKPCVASPNVCQSRDRSCQASINTELHDGSQRSSLKQSRSHCNACTERGLDLELTCATIWHGILPSHNLSVLEQGPSYKSSFASHHETVSSSRSFCSSSEKLAWHGSALSGLQMSKHTDADANYGFARSLNLPNAGSSRRDAMASGVLDGSWNVAWDARPARWLHGRNSAWLLFGVRSCPSMEADTPASSNVLSSSLLCVNERLNNKPHVTLDNGSNLEVGLAMKQREATVGYTIIGMPSDGRCLFRAIVYGALLKNGTSLVREELQQEVAADDLRNKVVDELVSQRIGAEWFIEDDFDIYVKRMREPYVWGGEPELLMASHVLKMPITVHLLDKTTGELITVAEYGKDYGVDDPIRVLYHGFGHYDALRIEERSET